MLFGHNSNVKVGEATFHVQTEDRGVTTALIDTTVYYGGRVMHRRTNNYHDLVPLNPDREEALRLRLDEQHRGTLEDIRSGALYMAAPQPPAPAMKADAISAGLQVHAVPSPPNAVGSSPAGTPTQSAALKLNLLNPRTWLTAKEARLEIAVFTASGQPQPGARVVAHIEGATGAEKYSGETNSAGQAEIAFHLPRLTGGDAALVIEAVRNCEDGQGNSAAHGMLRFALRSKSRAV